MKIKYHKKIANSSWIVPPETKQVANFGDTDRND